jgi:2-methylcitrate dehydratase PrpD
MTSPPAPAGSTRRARENADAAWTTGFTREVARASAGLRLADLSEAALRRAEHCILDFFANTIAGCRDPAVMLLLDVFAGEAAGAAEAGLVGLGRHVPLRLAALVNGTAGHALDYDDNNLTMPGHVSVAVIPALLALSEQRGNSGAEVLTALVAAFDAGCTIGAALAPGHYEQGFHATATIGAQAAAAGSANLLRLDPEATARAIGLAATKAAGLKALFGTMGKPLHAGCAAETGLMAAVLVERGFTAAPDAIEHRQGFAASHAPAFTPGLAVPRHGDRHIADNLFKFHAACYGTHAAIEAARRLRVTAGFEPQSIRRVELRVAASNDTVCNIAEPSSEAEARFSLRHVTAMALSGCNTADPASYGARSLSDPVVTQLRQQTTVTLVAGRAITLADVRVELKDGSTHEATADAGVPDADLDREADSLAGKFERLVAPLLEPDRTAALISELRDFRSTRNIGELVARSARRQG